MIVWSTFSGKGIELTRYNTVAEQHKTTSWFWKGSQLGEKKYLLGITLLVKSSYKAQPQRHAC